MNQTFDKNIDPLTLIKPRKKRSTRLPLNIDEIIIHQPIPKERIPAWGRGAFHGKRRWQTMVERIIEVSALGQTLPIELPLGVNEESVESSLREECKRQGYTLHKNWSKNPDGKITVFLFAEPRAEQRK